MRDPLQVIADLAKLRLAPVSPDMAECSSILKEELPFDELLYPSGQEYNGWVVPQSWHVEKATIHNAAGELIYNGHAHPLGVCMYSDSFVAGIGGEELKKHLYFSEKYDEALVYHCNWLYQPHTRSWGFSVPKWLYYSIGDRDAFHVELKTVHEPGLMRSLFYGAPHAQQQNGPGFCFLAHSCHPSLCNDDLSGIAVGVEVMRRLPKNTRNRYGLLVSPEHYGTIFPVAYGVLNGCSGGLFLEAFGTQGQFAHQQSYAGRGIMDRALASVLRDYESYRKPFRQVAGNDESVLEAVGIPCSSLTRYPFEEYHTSRDNVSLMDPAKLEEAVQVVLGVVDVLEMNRCYKRIHSPGLVCLSNPKYDLYKPFWDPSIPDRRTIDAKARQFNQFMNDLPQYINDNLSTLDMSELSGLSFQAVHGYLQQWIDKGLLTAVASL